MNDRTRPVTDDDLHAYVDDRLDPAQRRMVQAYLAQNLAQQRRVDGWIAQGHALRAAFAPVAEEPLPPELTPAHLTDALARRRSHWLGAQWRAAAGLVLAIGVGGAAGWFGHGTMTPGIAPDTGLTALTLETTAAYRIFAPTPAVTATNADTPNDSLLWQTLGHKFTIPDLAGAGFTRSHINWVATTHGPAAVVTYQNTDGTRLMLLVRHMDVPAPNDHMTESHTNGHTLFAWISNDMGFTVMSATATPQLHHIANQIRRAETTT
jgi:anti-sigma factor RsiW